MPTMLDPIPADVQIDLNTIKADLDIKINLKKLEKNLLIANWNIRAFGSLTEIHWLWGIYNFVGKALATHD